MTEYECIMCGEEAILTTYEGKERPKKIYLCGRCAENNMVAANRK